MKKKRRLLFVALAGFFLILTMPVVAQITTSIYEVTRTPDSYVGESIVVRGIVTQYIPGTAVTVGHYLLQDDDGAMIRVNTNKGRPETFKKHVVTGVLYLDGRELFISETDRMLEKKIIDPLLIIIIVVGALLLLGIILYFSQQKKSPGPKITPSPHPFSPPTPQPKPAPPTPDPSNIISGDPNKTIIVDREYYTMKALPCSLIILSGPETNKELKLFGSPDPEGIIITLGRNSEDWKNHVKPGAENSHLRIEDNTRTLSRMQAELRYKDGIMYLKNLGGANPTHVDGRSLAVGEIIELKNGAIITAGHLKLQYKF